MKSGSATYRQGRFRPLQQTTDAIGTPYAGTRRISVLIAAALSIPMAPAYAQLQPSANTHGFSTFGSGDASASLSGFNADSATQIDVLFGRNSTGPYQLSWKNAHQGTDVVVRNSMTLQRDTDYTIDLAAGTITFTLPLTAADMVRVSYRTDTLTAVRTAAPVSIPLQWDIYESGKNLIRFSSLLRSVNSASPTGDQVAYTALQFTGSTRFAPTSTASTGLFLDLHNGDILRRGGFRFGDQTKLATGVVKFDYMRAGSLFAQGDGTGITAGRELLQATGSFAPTKLLALDLFARQSTLLSAAPGTTPDHAGNDVSGPVTRDLGGTLTASLPHGAKLVSSLTETTQRQPTGDTTQTTKDSIQIADAIARGTQATVGYDAQTTVTQAGAAPGQSTASYTQSTTVGIKSTPNKQVTITGSFQNSLDHTSAQDDGKISIQTVPVPSLAKLKLTTTLEDRYQKDGMVRNREALVDLPPLRLGQILVSGGVRETSAPGKDLKTGLFNLTAKPLPSIEVSGAARLRDGTLNGIQPDPNAVNTYDGKLALTPWKKFKITGTMTLNPELGDGTINRVLKHGVSLQTDFGIVTLHGQYNVENDYINTKLNGSTDFGMDVHLTHWDTLTTGFRAANLFDRTLSGQFEYRLGFTHKLGSIFDLSLSGVMTTTDPLNRLDADKPDLKAQAKFGLHF